MQSAVGNTARRSYPAPAAIRSRAVIREIARGRLATVELVEDTAHDGTVHRAVLKRVRPELANLLGWSELLSDEALLLSSIEHPNVVACYHAGREGGTHVLLQHIDGDSLESLLKRGDVWRWPRVVVSLVADVLRGLTAVHSACTPDGLPLGLVHQAPLPRHIMVGIDGHARLIDFSQARVKKVTGGGRRTERLRGNLTAPEQLESSGQVDQRADLFVLGGTLWECLTGEKLHGSTHGSAAHGLDKVRAPSGVGLKPPQVFDEICMRALSSNPQQRFASADEMLKELVAAAERAGGIASASQVGHWVRTSSSLTPPAFTVDVRPTNSSPSGRAVSAHATTMVGASAAHEVLEAGKKEAARLEALRVETAKQESIRKELARQEAARQEAAREEAARRDARREAARQEAARLDAARLEAARQEGVRQEAARQEAARLEAARLEEAAKKARRRQTLEWHGMSTPTAPPLVEAEIVDPTPSAAPPRASDSEQPRTTPSAPPPNTASKPPYASARPPASYAPPERSEPSRNFVIAPPPEDGRPAPSYAPDEQRGYREPSQRFQGSPYLRDAMRDSMDGAQRYEARSEPPTATIRPTKGVRAARFAIGTLTVLAVLGVIFAGDQVMAYVTPWPEVVSEEAEPPSLSHARLDPAAPRAPAALPTPAPAQPESAAQVPPQSAQAKLRSSAPATEPQPPAARSLPSGVQSASDAGVRTRAPRAPREPAASAPSTSSPAAPAAGAKDKDKPAAPTENMPENPY